MNRVRYKLQAALVAQEETAIADAKEIDVLELELKITSNVLEEEQDRTWADRLTDQLNAFKNTMFR